MGVVMMVATTLSWTGIHLSIKWVNITNPHMTAFDNIAMMNFALALFFL